MWNVSEDLQGESTQINTSRIVLTTETSTLKMEVVQADSSDTTPDLFNHVQTTESFCRMQPQTEPTNMEPDGLVAIAVQKLAQTISQTATSEAKSEITVFTRTIRKMLRLPLTAMPSATELSPKKLITSLIRMKHTMTGRWPKTANWHRVSYTNTILSPISIRISMLSRLIWTIRKWRSKQSWQMRSARILMVTTTLIMVKFFAKHCQRLVSDEEEKEEISS